jgi:hypothetical protein
VIELREPPAPAGDPGPSPLDALVWPGESAAWLAGGPAGPDAIAALTAIDPGRLDHAGRIDYLVAVRRQQAHLAALEQRVLADLAVAPDPTGKSWVAEEVASSGGWPGGPPRRRIRGPSSSGTGTRSRSGGCA